MLLVVLLGSPLASPALAQEASRLEASLRALRAAAPGVTWETGNTARGDVTCDGRTDVIAVGYQGRRTVWIGLVPGGADASVGEPIVGSFSVGDQTEESFCTLPVRLELQRLACENEDGSLPGCRPVDGCLGFTARDDACDGFHFFWNSERATITWWRR